MTGGAGGPGAGLVPVCAGPGHAAGRRPIGHILDWEDGMQTFRSPDEPVFEPGAQEGCGRVWDTAEAGIDTVHVCSRPDGHKGLHRCADGCWWNGIPQKTFLIWSLSQHKWMGPGFRGYVDGSRPAGAGRFDITDARKTCRRDESPMSTWATTAAWPALRNLPCIYLPTQDVPAELGAAELDELIERAASSQIRGWTAYWREAGRKYVACPPGEETGHAA